MMPVRPIIPQWLKCLPGLLLALLAFPLGFLASAAAAPTVGPEVAVMNIRIGKERHNRQIILGLYDNSAPVTTTNFKDLARRRFYRGIRFHRLLPGTLVQTGDPLTRWWLLAQRTPLRVGTGGPGFTLPPESRLPLKRGSVAMARTLSPTNPGQLSNGSQFFISLAPAPKLNGQFTVFGEVLEGLETLDEISNLPTDTNDFPLQNIIIRSIKIVPRFSDAARP